MITPQQNIKFPYNVVAYLVRWSQRPIKLLLSDALIISVVMLTLVGGIFFWTSRFNSVFLTQYNDRGELEIARSGLQTMKRMVSDPSVWSESVQEEYNKLFAAKPIEAKSTGDIYKKDNFVESNYPVY